MRAKASAASWSSDGRLSFTRPKTSSCDELAASDDIVRAQRETSTIPRFLGATRRAQPQFYDPVMDELGYKNCRGRAGLPVYAGRRTFIVAQPLNGEAATVSNGGTLGFARAGRRTGAKFHEAGLADGRHAIEDPPGLREPIATPVATAPICAIRTATRFAPSTSGLIALGSNSAMASCARQTVTNQRNVQCSRMLSRHQRCRHSRASSTTRRWARSATGHADCPTARSIPIPRAACLRRRQAARRRTRPVPTAARSASKRRTRPRSTHGTRPAWPMAAPTMATRARAKSPGNHVRRLSARSRRQQDLRFHPQRRAEGITYEGLPHVQPSDGRQ